MLQVYHFILDHRVGGPHIYVDTLRKALSEKIESIIVTTGSGSMTNIALYNFRHYWAPFYAFEIIANIFLLLGLVLLGRIKRKGVVFNVHGAVNIAPILAARIVGIPVVWHFHETVPSFRRLVQAGVWLLKKHPHVLVVVADKAKQAYNLENTEFIPASVDTKYWSPEQVCEEDIKHCGWIMPLVGCEQPLKVVAVGNLNPLKGMDILLEAMAKLKEPWHLKIVGVELETHSEYANRLYESASEILSLKKGCAIDFLGWQEKAQVRILLASTDIFVLPSRSEACPIALLEAMAMGCICAAADVGDVRAMLEGYPRGNIFPVGSIESLNKYMLAEQVNPSMAMLDSFEVLDNGPYQLSVTSAKAAEIYSSLVSDL